MSHIFKQLSDYDFFLPAELIATEALKDRAQSRLLCLAGGEKVPTHDYFSQLGCYLKSGDVLVVNNSKVMKARIYAYKPSGGRVEILLIRPLASGNWLALMNGKGPFLPGAELRLFLESDNLAFVRVLGKSLEEPGAYELEASCDLGLYARKNGEMPLPPYFGRKAHEQDEISYQTIFATDANLGAIAAPTAGLHFTPELIKKLKEQGVKIIEITLHVGPGTFLPIRAENIDEHVMHVEYFSLSEEAALVLNQARRAQNRIIAVGTTALRVLEQVMLWALEHESTDFFACSAKTSLFIKPGHKFLGCDALITNFHVPRSTLFVLICALLGRERAFRAYEQAIQERYRFFSYGDACYFEIVHE